MTEENKTTDAPVPGSPDYPLHSELTIGAYLKQQVAIDPDHEFVVYPDRDLRWTYKDFDERTDALAKGLLAIGMKPGDHLGVWARNIPDWLTFMYASAKIGVVMVTVNPVYKSHELDYVLKQSDMKALCVIDAYRDVDYLQIIRDLVPESLNVQRVNAALSNLLLEKSQPSKATSVKSAPVKSQSRNWQLEKRPPETSSSTNSVSAAWSARNSTPSSVPRSGSRRTLKGASSRGSAIRGAASLQDDDALS